MRLKRFLKVALAAGVVSFATVSAHAETLKEALTSAYSTNPNIASALLSVKASAEDIAIRRSGKLPSISASADYTNSWSMVGGSTTTSNTVSVGLTYRQTLFDNLQTDAQVEQARAMTVVASQALRNAEQNVLLSAATSYLNVIRDTQLVQLRSESMAFFQAQVSSANDRLEIGEGTRIDVSQAEARLAQSVASYRDAVSSLQVSQAGFARWIGHNPQNLSMGFDFGGTIPASLNQAISLAQTQHPAILSAQAQVRAAQSSSDAAKAAFGPTLDLIGSIGGNSATGISGSIRLSLSIPLYSGGAMGASLRQANLRQIGSELDALSARDQVVESVISAWNGVQNANSQITSAQAQVTANQAVLDGVIQERNVGQSTTLQVLDAQANLITVREVLISASSSKLIASFSLLASIGRLSADDLGLPVQFQSADGYIRNVEDVWAELRSVPAN